MEERRRFIMRKPQHVVEGMQQAAHSVYFGLEGGVTGLFTAPYRGACEDGVTGFVGGMFKGVTGVVTKPLAGVLDATAKAA